MTKREFLDIVFALAPTEANAIMDAFDEYVESSEPHWIPVTERLPYAECGESNNVIATCGYRDVEDGSIRWIKTLYFNGGNWCYPTGETYLEKVYAWMPLPEPYKPTVPPECGGDCGWCKPSVIEKCKGVTE